MFIYIYVYTNIYRYIYLLDDFPTKGIVFCNNFIAAQISSRQSILKLTVNQEYLILKYMIKEERLA